MEDNNLKITQGNGPSGAVSDKPNDLTINDIFTKCPKDKKRRRSAEEQTPGSKETMAKSKKLKEAQNHVAECSNRYEVLADPADDSDMSQEEEGEQIKDKNGKKNQPPKHTIQLTPLVLHGKINSHAVFTKTLNDITNNEYHIKYHRDKTEIFTTTQEDYTRIMDMYKDRKIDFHTYTLPVDKKKTFVIYGLPKNVDPNLLKKDLEEQGYEATNVQIMKGTEPAKFMATLPARITLAQLKHKVHYVCYTKILWKDYENKR